MARAPVGDTSGSHCDHGTTLALRSTLLYSLLFIFYSSIAACAATNHPAVPENTMNQLVILSQSIGRGVPAETREALAKIVELLRSEGLQPSLQAWGLEGEKRVCVALTTNQLDRILPGIEAIASNVELLNLDIKRGSESPCK